MHVTLCFNICQLILTFRQLMLRDFIDQTSLKVKNYDLVNCKYTMCK